MTFCLSLSLDLSLPPSLILVCGVIEYMDFVKACLFTEISWICVNRTKLKFVHHHSC
jgi:hypothetical protein